jgi:molecular chaperone GrpE
MGENEPTPTVEPSDGKDEKATPGEAPKPAEAAAEPAQDAAPAPASEAPPEPEPTPIPEDPELLALRASLDTARKDLEQAQTRLRTVSKGYTDLQAEMKSFRERMEARAKLDSELQAFEQVKRFFDPVMNLRRSIANPGSDVALLVEGLKMVNSQFMEALAKLGLEEVPGEGSTFDPNLHEALAVTPVDDPSKDGKVLAVHTSGYAVKGRVLQPAQVVIGKYQDAAGEA